MNQSVLDLITEVFKKCYYISNNSKCDVFFRYSPHVNFYEVEYHLCGWVQNKDAIVINRSSDVNEVNLKITLKKLDNLWKNITNEMGEIIDE